MAFKLVTISEHIGDHTVLGKICDKDFLKDPGLEKTLMGDGIATAVSGLLGGPANTTYGENTGVLALSKVYDPRVVRLAAYFAIAFSFSPKFAALINSMPAALVGGISFVLYGMISAVGVRNLVENKVDFTNNRNVLIAALILVLAIGISTGPGSISLGKVSLSGLAVAALIGIILNAVLPGKDFEMDYDYASGKRPGKDSEGMDESFKVSLRTGEKIK